MRSCNSWLLALALALGLGTPAAACPTAEDLTRGLIFAYEARDRGGVTEPMAIYTRRAEDGRIATTFHPQLTGDPWQSYKHAGILDAEAERRSGGQRAEGTFDPALLAALPPEPGAVIIGDAQWTRPGQSWTSSYRLEAGEMGEMGETQIGDCTYSAFPLSVRETRSLPDGTIREFTSDGWYIPDLVFFNTPPPRSVAGFTTVRTPRFTERFNWPFRGL